MVKGEEKGQSNLDNSVKQHQHLNLVSFKTNKSNELPFFVNRVQTAILFLANPDYNLDGETFCCLNSHKMT